MMATLERLPPPEDHEEYAMDARPIRYSLDLDQQVYFLLCTEQNRRRLRGVRGPAVSLRAIILDAIRAQLEDGP